MAELCRTRGVPRSGVFVWRRRLGAQEVGAAGLVEVRAALPVAGLVLELGKGRWTRVERGFDGELRRPAAAPSPGYG